MPVFRSVTVRSFAILVLVLMAAVAQAATGTVLHEGTFSPADLSWERVGTDAARPVVLGTRHLALPGAPDLPVAELLLLVPTDRVVTDLVVEPLATHAERLPASLAAVAAPVSSEGEAIGLAADAAKAAPGWGELTGQHLWRGQRLVTVQVRPLREGADGALEFLDAYAVRAVLGAAPAGEDVLRRQRLVPGEAAANAAILERVVANRDVVRSLVAPQGVAVQSDEKAFIPTPLPSLTGSAVPYVIITSEALKSEFQRLADHKTARGLATTVVTREFIDANYRHGADIQETMRMFIRDAYQMWGAQYVLLGGDSDILPPRYVNNTLYPAGSSTDIPCDLYFQCLDGNWNDNGNEAFGEPLSSLLPSDNADFAEEVYIGRAPVATPAQATVFVDKVIAYEKTGHDKDWTNRILLAAEVLFPDDWAPGDLIQLDGSDYAELEVDNSITPCSGMESLRMYQTFDRNVGDVILTKAALRDSLNTGHYGIVNQIGHGYFYTMSVGDNTFNNPDADALVNGGDRGFMIYALNCASAAFDYSCLMERFLQNAHGGSVSSIGAVRAAFPVTSNNYQQEFFSQLTCDGEAHQGALVALSRLPWLGSTSINYTDRWTYENYTLLGDPTMELWTSSPQQLAVSAPVGVGMGPQAINVTVTSGGSPVEGARVCAQKPGEDWAFALTNAAGVATLDVLPVSLGNIKVTVSGPDLEHTERTVPVVAGGAYLAVTGLTYVDNGTLGSSGNGNGKPEAGETVAAVALLQETGGFGATGISGVMSATVPGVTITAPNAAFPSVGPSGSATSSTPFMFTIDPDVADGTPIDFAFDVSSSAGLSHSVVEGRILAPELEIVAIDWEDQAWGNGDGLLGSGERTGITFRAKNFGAGRADVLTAYLRSDDGNVVLYDTLTVLPALESMDEAVGATIFSQALLTNARRSISRVVVVDNYGRTTSQAFYPQRPESPTVIATDASQGADVITLSWDQSVSEDVVGYNVYRSTNPAGPFVQVNADVILGTTYFRDEGLAQLTKYYYRVASVDSVMVPSVLTGVVSQSTAPAEAAAFPLTFQDETSSHLAVGDVDGDGMNDIVLASDEVYVWHHDGTELLDGDGNSQTLGPMTDLNSILQPAGVVLAELDGVPGLEMIISERGNTQAIHVFNKDGQELPGWPRSLLGVPGTRWNWATPAVGDIDGDGSPEIVVNTLNGRVWAWHVDGSEVRDGDANAATDGVFFVRAGADYEWAMSGPALADLDGDGKLDIIFGTRNDATGLRRLIALRYDGTFCPGFPVNVTGQILCHPAVGDLDGDGVLEIVVYTSGRYIYVVHQDGTPYQGFPIIPGNFYAAVDWVTSPALGDLDGDGELEIVIAGNQTGTASALWAFDTGVGDGTSGHTMPGWPQPLPGSSEGSPVIADINGDGSVDVIHGIGGGASTAPNNLYAFTSGGAPIDGFPITLGGPVMPSVTVTDLERDGDVDIVYGGWDRLIHVWDMPFDYSPLLAPWPTFQANVARTGQYFPVELVGVDDGPGSVPAAGFTMGSPYPNPFNPSTSVRLYVPRDGQLKLTVHDVRGRVVRVLHDGHIAGGWQVMTWDGRDDAGRMQASGMYFMRADADQAVSIHKMTLVK